MSIAKDALLAHQVSIQVTGHNVANVDTPGYTRQTLNLTTANPVPSRVGPIGSGVYADYIQRHYDQFTTQRIMEQNSLLASLGAQMESLQLVETTFNEASGLALNDLFSQFWESWQGLSDNPEILSSRQTVVQQAELVGEQLNSMMDQIAQSRYDFGVSLQAAIGDVNSLTAQIADLNIQIGAAESGNRKANDLRDIRDVLLQELAKLVDITYFEPSSGQYTIMLQDGHTLVESNEHWKLDWEDGELQWLSIRRLPTDEIVEVTTSVGTGAELGGKIGGTMEVYNLLAENDPENFAGRLNALAEALIREMNQQHSQGVGMVRFSGELTGAEIAEDTAALTSTLESSTAATTVSSGTFTINDREVGKIVGGVASYGLATIKAYNTVEAINEAITGVTATLTTQVAGSAVTPIAAAPADVNNGDVITFTINGVTVNYTVDNDGAGDDDTDAAIFAQNLVDEINGDIATYNATNTPDVTVEAVLGDGANGGVVNSIILKNINKGDDSRIVIGTISSSTFADPSISAGLEGNLGLTAGTYTADATNNTGEITLFSVDPFTVEAGTNDVYLDHFGWGGGSLSSSDTANDGQFTYTFADGGVAKSLQGYDYADQLVTDGGSFEIWLYNNDEDNTLALAQPVTVSMERAYDLSDVMTSINDAITTATGMAEPWVKASISQNRLVLTADDDYTFAFANDTSNFLQAAGINTFFSGSDASTISVNSVIKDELQYIAAGTVGDSGLIFTGDNTNALLITNIQRDEYIEFTGASEGSLDGHYNALVAEIGMKGRTVQREFEFNTLVSNQLNELRDSVSGVNLDEEIANLIKFQHAYSAAAKLISISDEMLRTLLDVVR